MGVISVNDLEEYVKAHPGTAVFARYAEQLIEEGKIDKAIDILLRGLETYPNYAPGHSVLATAYYVKGREDEAGQELEKALRLDCQMPVDLLRMGRHFLNRNVAVKALPNLWAARRFEPHNTDITELFDEASILLKTQQDLNLTEQSERALSELTEDHAEAETLLAESDSLDVSDAEEAFAQTVASARSDMGADISDEFDTAAEDLEASVSEKPNVVKLSDDNEAGPDGNEIDRYLSSFESAGEKIEDDGAFFGKKSGVSVAEQIEPADILDVDSPAVVDDDTFDALIDEGAPDVSDVVVEEEETDAALSFEEELTGSLETFADRSAETEEIAEVSDDEFDALLDAGAPDISDVEVGEESAVDELSLEEELIVEPEMPADDAALLESLEEVGDDEFDALLEEGAPDVSEEKITPGEDEAFEKVLTGLEKTESESAVPSEDSAEAGGDEFDILLGESAPDAGDEDEITDVEPAAESVIDDSLTESAEEESETPDIDEAEIGPFEEEVAKHDTYEDVDREPEPVGAGSGDVPEIVGVHEIGDDDIYASILRGEDSDFAQAVDEPVLSDEERAELMAFDMYSDKSGDALGETGTTVEEAAEDTASDTGISDILAGESDVPEASLTRDEMDVLNISTLDESGEATLDETVEDIELLLTEDEESSEEEDGGLFVSELSPAEMDELSESREERSGTSDVLEEERREGIDYSDVLAELLEPRDIEDSLEEAAVDMMTEDEGMLDIDETEAVADDTGDDTIGIDLDTDMLFESMAFGTAKEEAEEETEMSAADEETISEAELNVAVDEIQLTAEEEFPETHEDEETDENVKFVEDLIKGAPDVDYTHGTDEHAEESDVSFDDLIAAYELTIGDSSEDEFTLPQERIHIDAVKTEYRREPEEPLLSEDDGMADADEGDSEELTATMAEIYVSQGLTGQAIKIYETILKKQPDNERAAKRLDELQNLGGKEPTE